MSFRSASAISGGAFTAMNTGNGLAQFSWPVAASLTGSASPTPTYAGNDGSITVTMSGSGVTANLPRTVTVLTTPGESPIATAPAAGDVSAITLPVDTLRGDGIGFGQHVPGIAFAGSGGWSQVSAQGTVMVSLAPDLTATSRGVQLGSPAP